MNDMNTYSIAACRNDGSNDNGRDAGLIETCPTTLRFSRRAGEAFRGADYAQSVEAPRTSKVCSRASAVAGLIALSLLAALALAH
jgi:hypothetical protein